MTVLTEGVAVLSRTPSVLDTLLRGLPDIWLHGHEGPGTWTPVDVVGHLIHTDRTNWIPRARILLAHGESRPFDVFNRAGHMDTHRGRSLDSLLDEFAAARRECLDALAAMNLTAPDLDRRGRHPDLGPVTLGQLLASWVAHDLDHLVQISRVMAVQYRDSVGPWREYMRVLREKV